MARRRKRKPSAKPAAKQSQARSKSPKTAAAPRGEGRGLRRLTDHFVELRFEPAASHKELVAVILLSFGALATGAGIYAQWFWQAETPPGYAPLLLAVGILLVVVYAFYAPTKLEPFVVGELGAGYEQKGKVTRTGWHEMLEVTFAHGAVVLKTAGKPIQVTLRDYPEATRLLAAEAKKRIPKRFDIHASDMDRIGPPKGDEGEQQDAEPPQVTGLTCRATEVPLSIEKDVRMCARCGALYHKKGIPNRCTDCARKLRVG